MAPAAAFRTEHVQQAPRGWRTRTIVPGPRSRHEVRIAFPPGPRRKGAGRVVEILHPADEQNPRCEISEKAKANPGELLIFGNPGQRRVSRVAAGIRPGHKRGCSCFACRAARGEKVNRGRANSSRLAKQREARERAGRIRGARLNPGYFQETLKKGSDSAVIWANTEAGPFHVQPYVNNGETAISERGKYKTLERARKKAQAWLDNKTGPNPKRAEWKKRTQQIEAQFYPAMDKLGAARRAGGVMSPEYIALEKQTDKLGRDLELARRQHAAAFNPKRSTPRRRRAGRNPSEEQQAVKLFQSFHGKDPKAIVEKHVSAAVRLDYTALGDLEYLLVETPLGKNAKFEFPDDGVKLASSPDGKQLYAIGGNQNLLPCLSPESREKDFIDLGEGLEVQYLARKVHGNFQPVSYYHEFGEINGARPRMMFDKLRKQIFFIGGDYFIDTSKGTSPGIEN